MPVLVVGAGFSGATLARDLAEAGLDVHVIEARDQIGGHCATSTDPETGVMRHHHGPHIFHTDRLDIWRYVQRFGRFRPYLHRVRARIGTRDFGLPINLTTINAFFGREMTSDEARAFIAAQTCPHPDPQSFHDQARAVIGPALYEAFFAPYTRKQWGRDPRDLPASVFNRLPVRFDRGASYFHHKIQAIPEEGYSAVIVRMLRHDKITLRLSTPVARLADIGRGWDHVFWTGPFDAAFGGCEGALAYRTLDFEWHRGTDIGQDCAVTNFPQAEIAHTRITDYRHFTPWQRHDRAVISVEYPREAKAGDIPYYPVRLAGEMATLARYEALAAACAGVSFVGRLGTYRYLDMDRCILEARGLARAYLEARAQGLPPPIFAHGDLPTCHPATAGLEGVKISRQAS